MKKVFYGLIYFLFLKDFDLFWAFLSFLGISIFLGILVFFGAFQSFLDILILFGHFDLFRYAKSLGEKLFVGIDSDTKIQNDTFKY